MFGLDPMSATLLGACFAVALLVYCVTDVIMSLQSSEGRRIQRRLAEDLGLAQQESDNKNTSLLRGTEHERRSAMARWLEVSQHGMSFQKLCDQAALPWPAYQVTAGIVGVGLIAVLLGIILQISLSSILLMALLVTLGPIGVIVFLRNRRLKKFGLQLPEVLELLSQCLRAGHSLQSGLQLVAEQLPDPAGTEFSRVTAEQGLGVPLEDALDHMAERVDVLDLRMFVTAVHIQRQTGGDLTELMDKLGEVIRDRLSLLGQVRALTAEGRLSGWVLSGLPIAVLLMLFQMNPEHPSVLFHHPVGKMMVVTAVTMQITGMLLIRKIINIKV